MNNAGVQITQLCESWWDSLADSSRAEQHRYAEQLLRLLGWQQPIPFSPKEGAQALSALPYLLRAGGQTTVAAYFVLPGTLEPPAAVVELGLDFCPATRILTEEARTLNVQYAFITDMYRSYFYDLSTDDLLLHASDPRSFNDELVLVLRRDQMERGALEELRRPPRSSVARGLREWCTHWIENIARTGSIREETATLAIDRMLVMRYLFQHDLFRRTKRRLEDRFEALSARAANNDPMGCGADLKRLFHDMWFDWQIDLFEANPELDKVIENDAIAAPLLKEFGLMSRCKFNIATILESFNHGEPGEKLRVRMVPDQNEERAHYLSRQTLATVDDARVEIDLMEEGYRAIFHWFDKVVKLYERLEVDYNTQTHQANPVTPDEDLFAWSERDADRPEACADHIAHACERGFGMYYNGMHQYRVGRLMLTLHLISSYAQRGSAVRKMPSLENVLIKRPVVLAAHRVMGTGPDDSPGAAEALPR